MPKISYVPKNFGSKVEDMIAKVNAIIEEFGKENIDLTVRAIYYQFVSRDWLPNTLKDYKRLASIIDDARLAGLVDWDHIQDRTRYLRKITTWSEPQGVINSAAHSYREDLWRNQKAHVEVWIEKDAGVGTIEGVCNENRLPFLSCRGYTSQSEMWRAGGRLQSYHAAGKSVHIIHLGDHDPSGIDMSRDIKDRLKLFAPGVATIHRIALNMNQVRKYNPPPNPAKTTDARCAGYQKKFGNESWELDALNPRIVRDLIQKTVNGLRDHERWQLDLAAEESQRKKLRKIAKHYPAVSKFVRRKKD